MPFTKTLLPVAILLACCLTLSGQELFTFAKDDSVLKRKFIDQIGQKKQSTLAAAEGDKSMVKEYKKIYQEQFAEIEKFIGGKCAFTDSSTYNYINRIAKKIFDANPILSQQSVRIVIARDWWPNAYSMGDGTIVFNAGLFAFLNDESEIAFILGHEMAHFFLDHTRKSILQYVETISSEEFQDNLKAISKQQYEKNRELDKLKKSFLFDSRKHSRQHESEADLKALEYLKNTSFDVKSAVTCLQLLDKIDDSSILPRLDVATLFNFPAYPFKKRWIQKESAIFSELGEENSKNEQRDKDSLKTHPDCFKRITLIKDLVIAFDNKSRRKFIVDEVQFNKLKASFIFEAIEHCFNETEYDKSLYLAALVLQQDKSNRYAIFAIARCLNKIYEAQKSHSIGNKVGKEDRNNPEDFNSLLRFFDRIKLDELANISFHFCNTYAPLMADNAAFNEEFIRTQKNLNTNK